MEQLDLSNFKTEIIAELRSMVQDECKIFLEQAKQDFIKQSFATASATDESVAELIEPFVPILRLALKNLSLLDVPLTIPEYAKLAGISNAAAYQRKNRGQLEFTKDGTRVLINPKHLNEILKEKALKFSRATN